MDNPQKTFKSTLFNPDSFWGRKRKTAYSNTLPFQLEALKSTGRYDAFKLEWKPQYADAPGIWPVPNHLFWDSDVAKWIEGACYFLEGDGAEDVELKHTVEELVEMIRKAQQPDGYLNIHFTVVKPDKRFSNLRDLHELYNAGHLIEAALAHNEWSGNDKLLQPMLKYVDLFYDTFGPETHQKHGYPGHPEIELALLRLYKRTKDPKHYKLAKYFLDERGNPGGQDGRHYYTVEAEKRGERAFERPAYYPKAQNYWYQQAHKPIVEQETIEGHSVRSMYLLTAVADLVHLDLSQDSNISHDPEQYKKALYRLWDNMVDKKMYVTGGIGSIEQWEGFSIDYFLPQGTDEGGCYAETCAAIGVMMLAERLLQTELDGRFADVMELCLYNAMLTGTSLDGKKFTYDNQLASSEGHPSKREEWFTCACCPPNVTRVLGYLGGYLWSHQSDMADGKHQTSINVHLYADATLRLKSDDGQIELTQTSNWPWEGEIKFSLSKPANSDVTIKLRIPHYVSDWNLSPPLSDASVEKSYLKLPSSYLESNPNFTLNLPLRTRLISPHPYTGQNVVALARGPIIYCVEDVDNDWVKDHFKSLVFDPTIAKASITETQIVDPQTNEQYVELTAHDSAILRNEKASSPSITISYADVGKEPYATGVDSAEKTLIPKLNFIPYYFRANRGGNGQMRVGLRRP